jgi:two-component system sensor histidine kinase KdpD
LFATLIGGVIATVGAHELTRSRLAEFEGRRAKEELLRARSDFVAMLTHDIKNPLAVIDGYVQMMRERAEISAEERDGLLARVQGSIRSALTLAINFLDASKIEADRIILRKQPIDVTQVLGQAVHTPPGGTVRVAARGTASGSVEVVVEDTGEGIQPGQESRIFDRYTSAASRADSTGLGLYIARTLTAAHGGTIGVENRQDGPGARFRVTLPALSPRPAEA